MCNLYTVRKSTAEVAAFSRYVQGESTALFTDLHRPASSEENLPQVNPRTCRFPDSLQRYHPVNS
jgi:hypothetical protein